MNSTDGEAARWQFELIDLTRPLTEESVALMFGDLSGEEYSSIPVEYLADWSTANGVVARFSLFDHAGTHMDAPIHTVEDAPALEDVDITRLIGEAVVLDLRRGDVDYLYTATDFEEAEPEIEPGDIVLMYSDFVPAPTPTDRIKQTALSEEAARWLVERGVVAVGCEPPGIEHLATGYFEKEWYSKDSPHQPSWPVHRTLLGNDVYIIEGLTNLDRIAGKRVRFAALPLNLPGLSGCPVRAVAWLDRSTNRS
ncbi:MAG: cyclase family protein [Gaiellaceae bacterium]